MPDFNPSLLGLMAISYGGLLMSSGASRKWPKKDLEVVDPEIESVQTVSTNPKQLKVRLRGFDLESVGARIDLQRATAEVVDETTGDVTLEVKEPFRSRFQVRMGCSR